MRTESVLSTTLSGTLAPEESKVSSDLSTSSSRIERLSKLVLSEAKNMDRKLKALITQGCIDGALKLAVKTENLPFIQSVLQPKILAEMNEDDIMPALFKTSNGSETEIVLWAVREKFEAESKEQKKQIAALILEQVGSENEQIKNWLSHGAFVWVLEFALNDLKLLEFLLQPQIIIAFKKEHLTSSYLKAVKSEKKEAKDLLFKFKDRFDSNYLNGQFERAAGGSLCAGPRIPQDYDTDLLELLLREFGNRITRKSLSCALNITSYQNHLNLLKILIGSSPFKYWMSKGFSHEIAEALTHGRTEPEVVETLLPYTEDLSEERLGELFIDGVKTYGYQYTVFEKWMQFVIDRIPTSFLVRAIEIWIDKHDYLEEVIQKVKHRLPENGCDPALAQAVRKGNYYAVETVLERANDKVTKECVQASVLVATREDCKDVLDYLLPLAKEKISPETMQQAWKIAEQEGKEEAKKALMLFEAENMTL